MWIRCHWNLEEEEGGERGEGGEGERKEEGEGRKMKSSTRQDFQKERNKAFVFFILNLQFIPRYAFLNPLTFFLPSTPALIQTSHSFLLITVITFDQPLNPPVLSSLLTALS